MLEMRKEEGSLRGRIYDGIPREIPLETREGEGLPPCSRSCPLGQDVRGYIGLMAEKRFAEALELIRETNPLPSVCGTVCHRPCEALCLRGTVDHGLSIRSLKRFAADFDGGKAKTPSADISGGTKVAIVGSGPAGLTAAHDLAGRGYRVEIIEAHHRAGGMLAWAIPDFRLPREILERDIEYLEKRGIAIRTGVRFGSDLSISSLKKEGAQAVVIATGTMNNRELGLENEKGYPGYLDCLSFLKGFSEGEKIRLGKRVLVIGGGNTAVDTARAAVRLGADRVTVVYRRGLEEMTADRDEVNQACDEGVEIEFLTVPVGFVVSKDRITGLKCVGTELVKFLGVRRKRPVIVEGTERVMEADTVIAAVGQLPDADEIAGGFSSKVGPKAFSKLNDGSMVSGLEGVFAAGDFVNGPTSVVEAMASGRKAAGAVDEYLAKKGPNRIHDT
ncbi:MAG: FAD-dependent oxidoreductase [Proteobacteria bacterium]|nr:FAD-dependent oxidoreductase [Pseudomonadota bacterium]